MYRTNKIAVLIATYNGQKFLSKQLNSLLAQTNKSWHGFIHDDGSTDRTPEIIKQYARKYPEHFTVVDGPPSGGAKENFFYLLKQVEAPVYMFCDQDDVWLDFKIEKSYEELRKIDSREDIPALVFTDLKVVDSNLNIISDSMNESSKLKSEICTADKLVMNNAVTGCTTIFNHCLRDAALKFQNIDNVIYHDWWIGLVAAKFGNIHFLDLPTILYRQHGGNEVGAVNAHGIRHYIQKAVKINEFIDIINKTQMQAYEISKSFELSKDDRLTVFSHIREKGKFERFKLLRTYGNNTIRKSLVLFIIY